MSEYDSIENVAQKIKNDFDSINNTNKNLLLLYAFNATGKTRISTIISKDESEITTLCFNAFTEDLFVWNNESFILNVNPKSWVVKYINEQGLEKEIISNFSQLVNSKLEPNFNLIVGEITFKMATGDNNYDENIKISRGEESIFIWSIFYSILESALDTLNMEESERETAIFNNLKYIIIDDPVSSIDDTRIISLAIQLFNIIGSYKGTQKINFLITTHHALFYNILYNSFGRIKNHWFQVLHRRDKKYELKNQNDSPFGYHLMVKQEIQKAIDDNNIQKYHFNLFRCLLEKTAYFLGYIKWDKCIISDDEQKTARIANLYSHDTLSDVEYKELSEADKELFKDSYSKFIKDFKWGGANE